MDQWEKLPTIMNYVDAEDLVSKEDLRTRIAELERKLGRAKECIQWYADNCESSVAKYSYDNEYSGERARWALKELADE